MLQNMDRNRIRKLLVWLSLVVQLCSVVECEDQFTYNGFLGSKLTLGGVANVDTNGLLQLTNTSKQKTGHAFHTAPISFFNKSNLSFSTTFVFAMLPEFPKLGSQGHGHGMAFAISPSPDLSQAIATQYLGLFNLSTNNQSSTHILAIELDTVLSPDFKDINENHVGVDVNSLASVDSAPAAYFSSQQTKNISLDLVSGHPMQVWIDYVEQLHQLNVTIAPASIAKPDHPLLSRSIDLSQILLEHMYVGFSAATGSIASDHYVLGWSFNRSGPAVSLNFSKLPKLPKRNVKNNKQLIVGLSTVATTIVLGLAVGAVYTVKKRRYRELHEDWEEIYGPQRLSYKTLYKATKGFRDGELLGEGGFGKVYRGTMASQARIAVKKVNHDSEKGMKQFVAEIASMGRLRHRNLVGLVGYCRRKGELILVYEYMPNGSLDRYLFSSDEPNLSWAQRFGIVRDVASALLYLHEEWEQVVLHRNVKASNVLLDENWNGRLGDFGLAKMCNHGIGPETTRVVGTVGYLAPELSRTGKASTATDVFSFGVLMLEVACGRRPLKPDGPPNEVLLVDWVFDCWSRGSILDAVDPKLELDSQLTHQIELVLKLALVCLSFVPDRRPTMRQIVHYLDPNVKATSAIMPETHPYDALSLPTFWSTDRLMLFPSSMAEMGSSTHNSAVEDDLLESNNT